MLYLVIRIAARRAGATAAEASFAAKHITNFLEGKPKNKAEQEERWLSDKAADWIDKQRGMERFTISADSKDEALQIGKDKGYNPLDAVQEKHDQPTWLVFPFKPTGNKPTEDPVEDKTSQ